MPANIHNPQLSPKMRLFTKNMVKGHTIEDSAKLAGYSKHSASAIGSQLLKRDSIRKELEKAGITENALATVLKKHIDDGIGVKASADTSLRATELSLKLMGHLERESEPTGTTNNTIIYNNYTDTELQARIAELQQEL
jgi:hypothetical protein